MKNLLILLTLIIGLCSCRNETLHVNKCNRFFVEQIEKSRTNGMCEYSLWDHWDFTYEVNGIWITDSIGKFDIGDTVYFTLNKKK